MFCAECGGLCSPSDKFCTACGQPVISKDSAPGERPRASKASNAGSRFTPAPDIAKQHQALVSKNRNKYRAFALIPLLAALGVLIVGLDPFFVLFFGFASVIILVNATRFAFLPREKYKTLPGAVSPDGSHACVYCGNPGIYRSTVYRTNLVRCACSKCGKRLFTEG